MGGGDGGKEKRRWGRRRGTSEAGTRPQRSASSEKGALTPLAQAYSFIRFRACTRARVPPPGCSAGDLSVSAPPFPRHTSAPPNSRALARPPSSVCFVQVQELERRLAAAQLLADTQSATARFFRSLANTHRALAYEVLAVRPLRPPDDLLERNR